MKIFSILIIFVFAVNATLPLEHACISETKEEVQWWFLYDLPNWGDAKFNADTKGVLDTIYCDSKVGCRGYKVQSFKESAFYYTVSQLIPEEQGLEEWNWIH